MSLCVATTPALAQAPLSEMVTIPAGPFTMGSNDGPEDERPAHEITVAAFSIDRFPATNAQYAEFLNGVAAAPAARLYDYDDPDARIHRRNARWSADAGFESHPVVEVPWGGAAAYCTWRGKRLPTEAEWEKAARGTDARRYPWGSDLPDRRRAQHASGYNETAPVDAFPAGASPTARGTWPATRGNGYPALIVPIRIAPTTAARTSRPDPCAARAAADTIRPRAKSRRPSADAISRATLRRAITTSVFAACADA